MFSNSYFGKYLTVIRRDCMTICVLTIDSDTLINYIQFSVWLLSEFNWYEKKLLLHDIRLEKEEVNFAFKFLTKQLWSLIFGVVMMSPKLNLFMILAWMICKRRKEDCLNRLRTWLHRSTSRDIRCNTPPIALLSGFQWNHRKKLRFQLMLHQGLRTMYT